MTSQQAAIEDLVQCLGDLRLPHPVRVAIDGRTASGKTTFADALANQIRAGGRQVIRASVDGFHKPRGERYRRGRLSADGYYQDARDLEAVRGLLLDPLGPTGDRNYVTASFDLDRDIPLEYVPERASEDAVLIVDGTFLQRPELRDAWDLVVFLDVSAEEALQRGLKRDAGRVGGLAATSELYARRYGPAFVRYDEECRPAEHADFIISGDSCIRAASEQRAS